MNRFALIGFWRSLIRHRLYAALNIGGLALGIAVFLVLSIYVRFETSYEKWLPGWQHIYQVESANEPIDANGFQPGSPEALWTAVSRDLPDTIGTRIQGAAATVVRNGVGVSENLAFVDPTFPKVFRLAPVAGDFADAFRNPANIVLTERTARKYFGRPDPIGSAVTVVTGGISHNYRVAAVVRDRPANTDLDFDMLAPLVISDDPKSPRYPNQHNWNFWDVDTYIVVPTADAVDRLTTDLKGVVTRHARNETPDNVDFAIQHRLKRMADVRFETPGKATGVATLGLVAILTLLVAIVNYVNLATARAGLRAREVAMRKVLGADRGTLLRHYLTEAIATTVIAAVIGLALAELAIPVMNAAIGLDLSIRYFGWQGILLPLVLLAIVVGLFAGIYPAIVLSRFPAAAVLASARSPGGGLAGTRIREGLVVVQFGIAIAFVIGTLVLSAQVDHVRNADVGYHREGLMLVRSLGSESLDEAARDTLMHRFAALPQVTATTIANNAPGPGSFTAESTIAVPGQPNNDQPFRKFQVTARFFDTMGARLVAGRLFDPSRPADVNPNYRADFQNVRDPKPYNIVINRAGLRALGFTNPQDAIGRSFPTPNDATRTVIGVIDDMRFYGAHTRVPPTMYEFVLRPPSSSIGILRFSGDARAMYQAVRSVWLSVAPAVPLNAMTAARSMEVYNASDDHTARLFTVGAVLAVAIGCVGLWGLASFNTARRIKEIGIRKTLGASSIDVVKLLVLQFLRPVLLANLIAWPLAFLAMRGWLAGFSDPIALSPLYFGAATLLATAVAVATVLGQSIRASRATPAWALRHE